MQRVIFKDIFFLFMILFAGTGLTAQDTGAAPYQRDSLLAAAREIMTEARFCALITLDEQGIPQARTMDPFAPDSDFVIWLGTNSASRKVREIRHDYRATLYYQPGGGYGYVSIRGQAEIVDDDSLKAVIWKEEWKPFYSKDRKNYTLIKFVPERLEVINYRHGIQGDKEKWDVPFVEW